MVASPSAFLGVFGLRICIQGILFVHEDVGLLAISLLDKITAPDARAVSPPLSCVAVA